MASRLTNSSAMVYTGTSTSSTILLPISSPGSSSSLLTGGPAVNISPSSPSQYPQGASSSSTTAIGAADGSTLFLCLVGTLIVLLVRRRRRRTKASGTNHLNQRSTQKNGDAAPIPTKSSLAIRPCEQIPIAGNIAGRVRSFPVVPIGNILRSPSICIFCLDRFCPGQLESLSTRIWRRGWSRRGTYRRTIPTA